MISKLEAVAISGLGFAVLGFGWIVFVYKKFVEGQG
ncbi:membrane protein [Streptomyces phage Bmoc]|uniref:Membrane protein n=1 Tax=Streptomyces phage Bmoc TaxID=2725629 RepID=A0A6M3T0N1_9CAUD|nr:membrane protein [Streptomyces phage Bmoc]QJD50948.1 membrane protein [Streptomyces phage Bmoc]